MLGPGQQATGSGRGCRDLCSLCALECQHLAEHPLGNEAPAARMVAESSYSNALHHICCRSEPPGRLVAFVSEKAATESDVGSSLCTVQGHLYVTGPCATAHDSHERL